MRFTRKNPWYFCENPPPPLSRVHRFLYRSMPYTSSLEEGAIALNQGRLVCNFIYRDPQSVCKGPQFYCYRDDHGDKDDDYDRTYPWLRIFRHNMNDLRAQGPHIVGLWKHMTGDKLEFHLIEICNLLLITEVMNK